MGKRILSASSAPVGVRYLRPDRERAKQYKRQAQLKRYEAVRQLYTGGMSMQQIARSLHLNRKTVAQWVKADAFPELMPAAPRPSILTPSVPYLQARYLEGERNGVGLFCELVTRGYPGSRMTVERFLLGLRALEQQGVPISVDTIHVCDRLDSNLHEIQLWKRGDEEAFNWEPFL